MLLDVRLAFRLWLAHPVLSAALVLLVALGVSVNTALFSVVDGLLLKPLGYVDEDHLAIVGQPLAGSLRPGPVSPRVWRQLADSAWLEALAAVAPGIQADGRSELPDEGIRESRVSASFFHVLAVAPHIGRLPAPVAGLDSGLAEAVVGYELWTTRFGGERSLVGRAVRVAGRSLQIVGVMPKDFALPHATNVWTMLPADTSLQSEDFRYLELIGRTHAVAPRRPDRLPGGVVIQRLRDYLRPAGTFPLSFLFIATLLVLVVTWVQVAGLQFTRALDRVREVAVRKALGAGRWSLVRQFAVEGVLMSAMSLALAWIATPALTALLVRWLPPELTRGQPISTDLRALVFAGSLATVGVLNFTLSPLGITFKVQPGDALRGLGPQGALPTSTRWRRLLLAAQFAVTAALMYQAGVTVRSYRSVSSVDIGFAPDGLIAVSLPADPSVSNLARRRQMFDTAADAVAALPGVRSVAGATSRPLRLERVNVPVGRPGAEPRAVRALWLSVTSGFFRTAGIAIREGGISTIGPLVTKPLSVVNSPENLRRPDPRSTARSS